MQVFRLIRPLLVGAVALLASQAHAAFSRVDGNLGADTLVYDSISDMHWLRLDLTYNLSFEFVTKNMDAGERFHGYRVASGTEVVDLFHNAEFVVNGEPGVWSPTREAANAQFVQAFGGVDFGDNTIGTRGRYATAFTPFQQAVAAAYYTPGAGGGAFDSAFVPDGFIDRASPNVGTWLVAPPVPEPGTYALMFGGLLAVAGVMRRRTRNLQAD